MWRNFGAVAVGALVLGAVVTVLQQLGSALYPVPQGIDPMNPDDAEAFGTYLQGMPRAVWLLAAGSEVLGAFLGAVAAGSIARKRKGLFAGAIVGLALFGSMINWTSFPHPGWFVTAQLTAYPLTAWLAIRLVSRSARRGE